MPEEETIAPSQPAEPTAAPAEAAPVAIEARGLEKAFRIPTHRVDSLKERVVRPFAARDYRELRALAGISFDVHRGEFFGIVGRNGSGKSTLLKLLASIYRADAGTIRMAGRLAPFIELGVGFNAELTARENIVLNGVMMGLTPAETRRRLDAVVDFAELHDFVDLRLKNYSSGMLVRLAFSLMLQVDADILLIDEVLAVGDAAFQQKCADAFHQMKERGKTIVLVTHEMKTVETYCHRAMLIEGGEIRHLGDPAEVGRRYLRLNFEPRREVTTAQDADAAQVRLLDAYVEGSEGEGVTSVEHGERVRLRVALETKEATPGLDVGFLVANPDGVAVSHFGIPVREEGGAPIEAGRRVKLEVEFENKLAPGRYFVHCGVNRGGSSNVLLYVHNCVDFVVYGPEVHGVVALDGRIEAEIEGGTP